MSILFLTFINLGNLGWTRENSQENAKPAEKNLQGEIEICNVNEVPVLNELFFSDFLRMCIL